MGRLLVPPHSTNIVAGAFITGVWQTIGTTCTLSNLTVLIPVAGAFITGVWQTIGTTCTLSNLTVLIPVAGAFITGVW